jgi:hypothetical protein
VESHAAVLHSVAILNPDRRNNKMVELTKKEKKVARDIFAMSIEKEFESALHHADLILAKWKNNDASGRTVFHEIHLYLKNFLKHLQQRYDDLRSSDYLMTLAEILKDGYITEDVLKDFSDEALQVIGRYGNLFKDES